VPDAADTQILQVLRRQIRQDSLIDMVFAECPLVLFEAKARSQPPISMIGALNCRRPASSAKHDNLAGPRGKDAILACG
jgi:hypothetical protein